MPIMPTMPTMPEPVTCGGTTTSGYVKFQYDFAQIAQAAADIRATSRNINGMLSQLKGDVAPMIAEWEGSSAVAYQDAQRRWDNSLEELNMVLDSVARTVDDANARMSQINTSAANSWA